MSLWGTYGTSGNSQLCRYREHTALQATANYVVGRDEITVRKTSFGHGIHFVQGSILLQNLTQHKHLHINLIV
jgi:hypothetical protein